MIITGGTWARFLTPECGRTLDSARFSVMTDGSTGERILAGNSCPGYDWTSQQTANTAGVNEFVYAVSSSPRISKSPIFVDTSSAVQGIIGVALNGVPIYSSSTPASCSPASPQMPPAWHTSKKTIFLLNFYPLVQLFS